MATISYSAFLAVLTEIPNMSSDQLAQLGRAAQKQLEENMKETSGLTEEELILLQDNKLSCIKSVRDRTGLGLVEARSYVERAHKTLTTR